MAQGAGADRLGQVLTGTDSERTWVECNLMWVGCLVLMTLAVSSVLIGVGSKMGGLTEEVRKVRITLAFLPLISIIGSIQCSIHYVIVI
jgi:hypothetical protein